MKIAYLAPELPALSATFVYNEVFKLETMGVKVVPFSVHQPFADIQGEKLEDLTRKVRSLYTRSKLTVLKDSVVFFIRHPKRYLDAVKLLISDMWKLGLFSRTSWGLVYRFCFSGSLASDLVSTHCSHIHVHFAHVPTDIAMYAATLADISFSVTSHANDLFERGWLLQEKVQRSGFFATISEFNRQFLSSKGINIDKVRIVRCGVNDEQFSQRPIHAFGSKVKIGVVGRLVEKKGIDTLIKAIALLKQQSMAIELHIAGSGPLQSDLMRLVDTCQLNSSDVVFLGSIPHAQVSEFITSLDIFVLPCKMDSQGDMDGIPVVLMEAMLSGVPVISSKLSGIPELVVDKETGLLVEPGNELMLVETISYMIHDKQHREVMIQQAIDKVRKDFSLTVNTNRLYMLFKTAIESKNSQKL